jgi:hypothetical protein
MGVFRDLVRKCFEKHLAMLELASGLLPASAGVVAIWKWF